MCKTRLGHVHLKVRDLERSIDFYMRFLGLKLNERMGDQYAFLSNDSKHHEIALQCVGKAAPIPASTCTGLYHLAFEVPDQKSFAAAYAALETAGIKTILVDHLISWAIDFTDPDGTGIEIYWDTRAEPGGQALWRGRNLSLLAQRLSPCQDGSHIDHTATK
jgi:catechol 2,3-dioxygenase